MSTSAAQVPNDRLPAIVCLREEDVALLLHEGKDSHPLLPEAARKLKGRSLLFIRLCAIRLFQVGLADEAITAVAAFLADVIGQKGLKHPEAWVIRTSGGLLNLVTSRPYMIDALARAKQAATILDLAEAWRATA